MFRAAEWARSLGQGMVWGVFDRSHGSFIASTAFVQLLPLISAPIVMRLYSPSAWGTYAVFSAVATIAGATVTLALHNAILIEKEARRAASIGLLSFLLCVFNSILIGLCLLLAPDAWLASALGAAVIDFLPFLAIAVLLSGCFLTAYTWLVRVGDFGLLARSKLVQGVSIVFVQIGTGMTQLGPLGLILANIVGFGLGLLVLMPRCVAGWRENAGEWHMGEIGRLTSRHKGLVLYSVPANLINSLGSQLPELLINRFFGVAMVGQYSLANRIVNQPLSLIATSVQDIFRQKASEEIRMSSNCVNTFKRFGLFLTIVSILIVVPLVLFGPAVFKLAFGSEWRDAGVLVQALAFLIALRFISSPLSYVWILKGRQGLDMLWQFGLLLIVGGAFFGVEWIFPDASLVKTLFFYSGLVGLWYAICIMLSYRFAK